MEPEYRVKPPLSPEENPPENLEDLETLIEELEQKALEIKHQIEVAESREKNGEPYNQDWHHRVSYALKCTRYSITKLQRIAKKKRTEEIQQRAAKFEAAFVEVARDTLDPSVFEDIKVRALNIANSRDLLQQNSPGEVSEEVPVQQDS